MFASLPQSHRVEKNAYASMLQHRFPKLMEIPEQSMWSLPDWDRDVRAPGALRDFWLQYLDRGRVEAGVLGGVLDGDAFVARRDAYFAAAAPPPLSKPFKARFPLRSRVLPIVLRTGPGFLPRSDFDLMRCVALVNILEESLDRFGAAPAR
jgi:hypothetical protein